MILLNLTELLSLLLAAYTHPEKDIGTAVSDPIVPTLDDFNRLKNKDQALRIRIRLAYTDYAGEAYETRWCSSLLAAGGDMFCDVPDGNYIH